MDFDEYEYLEKTVENPEAGKEKEQSGRNGTRSEEKNRSRSTKHRPDDDGRESNHRSKRARSEDEGSRDRDRRGSSRHRPSPDQRSRDGERDRNRSGRDHREERNGKDRERDKEKERGRTGERERESERERSRRSRSRSERHRDEERERHRERSRETTELKERDRDTRNAGERSLGLFHRNISSDAYEEMGVQRYKEKKEEVPEPEADPERDQRTVFAYQICLKADERDVYEFFSRAGKVRDVRLIMDRNSRRSKGVGYIEFYDALSVPMAIALSGQLLLGQQVMVKPSEAEKNLVQSNSTVVGPGGLIGPYSGGARRLYVGNLHFNITEDQLRKVFEPFGAVELVQLPRDQDTLLCKGFGFVQFARLEDARAALSLNGQLEIAGKLIKVNAITDPGMQDIGANTGDFDDDEGGGLSLNAQSRAALMQKLDRSGTVPSVAGVLPSVVNGPVLPLPTASVLGVPPGAVPLLQNSLPALLGMPASGLPVIPVITPPAETVGVPTECLLLKNMFDPNVETEPDFDLDIKEDVQDECSKFGAVKHIFVEKNSAGHVYLRFDSATSAANAQRALHGRWFAGKMITATFMLPQQYDAKFPGNS